MPFIEGIPATRHNPNQGHIMTSANTTARANLIKTIADKIKALQAELAAFPANSRAARAVQLREEIAGLIVRKEKLEAKLNKETVIDNKTGKVEDESTVDSAYQKFAEARDNFLKARGATSGSRYLVALLSSLLVATGLGWALNLAVNMLTAVAIIYTGSAFLGMLIYIIGMVVSIVLGVKLMSATFNYINDGVIDSHYQLVKSYTGYKLAQVKSLFSSSKPVAVA